MIADIRENKDKGKDRDGPSFLLTDFGIVALPPELEAVLDAAPKRRDGDYDRRYRAGKVARKAETEFVCGLRERFDRGEAISPA